MHIYIFIYIRIGLHMMVDFAKAQFAKATFAESKFAKARLCKMSVRVLL